MVTVNATTPKPSILVEDLEGLMTPTQTAQRLRLSTVYLAKLDRLGRLPAIRTPLGRLYLPSEVERYAAHRAQQQRHNKAGRTV